MQIFDLSHAITTAMPAYPGEEPRISPASTLGADGFCTHRLTIFSHTGTHVDAPAHILQGARTLERMNPERFVGPGCGHASLIWRPAVQGVWDHVEIR